MRRKSIAVALSMALLTGVLSGCGEKKPVEEPDKGRYVETRVELPAELEGWKVEQLFAAENAIHLLASTRENGNVTLREWALEKDGFKDVTQEWLTGIVLSCGEWMDVELIQDADGIQYLFAGYVKEGEDAYKGHLWRGEGSGAKDITPQKWTVADEEWGGYEYVKGVAALDNGTLATVSYTYTDIVDGKDGSVLQSEPLTVFYEDSIASDGENVYLWTSADAGAEIHKRKNGDTTSIILPQNLSSAALCVLKDGTLYAAGVAGIFRCASDEASWEKLLNGSETDFALTSRWCIDMAVLQDGGIYALFAESGGGRVLNKYEYDPNAVTEVTQELKLYSVYESYLLQQAAVMYHKEHPEVLITIEYVYPRYYYGETDYETVYQNLNTLLMGSDAPDILVMDHLNMDSYASKGLLENINDVVGELEEKGELLSNITGAYTQEDGSRYVVPLQFGFTFALGREIAVENMESLESLADFLSTTDYSYMGSQTVSELVDEFYPYFCRNIINAEGNALDVEVLNKILDYLKAVADNCGIITARGKDESRNNVWDLAGEAKLAFIDGEGFMDCMLPIAIMNYIGGDFTAFENSFVPYTQMGICTKTQYMDTAKDFLRFVLSEEIQDTDHYSGFPVNRSSLKKQSLQDRSEAEAETAIEVDGGYEEFIIGVYPPEIAERLVAICEKLDKPIKEDEKIREVLIEALEAYLNGAQSKDETVQKIEGGLKMYLAE